MVGSLRGESLDEGKFPTGVQDISRYKRDVPFAWLCCLSTEEHMVFVEFSMC